MPLPSQDDECVIDPQKNWLFKEAEEKDAEISFGLCAKIK